MIQLTSQMSILLAVEPVDFRKGIDGLAAVCKNVLGFDPFCGYMFVFMNKKLIYRRRFKCAMRFRATFPKI